MTDLDYLYDNLLNGKTYRETLMDVTYPCSWYVLGYNDLKKIFYWRNYRVSAVKATKEDLQWLLDNVYKMTATEFLRKYQTGMQIVDPVTHEKYIVEQQRNGCFAIMCDRGECGMSVAVNNMFMPLYFESEYEAEMYMGRFVKSGYDINGNESIM